MADESMEQKETTVSIYGKEVSILYKTRTALWWNVTGEDPVRIVMVQDPEGELDDRVYFSRDPDMSVEEIISMIARRWGAEVMHRNTKQHLGIEEPENGYTRGEENSKDGQKDPRIREDQNEEHRAAKRTVPLGLVVYGIVILWYLENGCAEETVNQVMKKAPYWRQKEEPSFADMLEEVRREIWRRKFLPDPVSETGAGEIIEKILPYLSAA